MPRQLTANPLVVLGAKPYQEEEIETNLRLRAIAARALAHWLEHSDGLGDLTSYHSRVNQLLNENGFAGAPPRRRQPVAERAHPPLRVRETG